ncbi:MAG: hypothetical protein U1F60_13610 [Planctomycetota bacterium]
MRLPLFLALAATLVLPSCFQLALSGNVGYAQLGVSGDVGYVSGTGSTAIRQDVESAFGLGDKQGAPYGRVALDTGVQVLSVSAFTFSESGRGNLQADFGDIVSLPGGVPVQTSLDLTNIKAAYALQISLGPVAISPGIAADYFDLDLQVRDTIGIATEDVQLNGPLPLAFVRGEVDLGVVSAIAEVGYMEAKIDQVSGSLLDVEAMLQYHPTPLLSVFAGYRGLNLQLDGQIDGDTIDADLTISGFILGGGVRF